MRNSKKQPARKTAGGIGTATQLGMLVVSLSLSIVLSGCGSSTGDQPSSTNTTSDNPLRNSNLFIDDSKPFTKLEPTAKRTPSKPANMTGGLIYQDIEEGFGLSPSANRQVYVHYTGYLTDGTKFESSLDKGVPFVFKIGSGSVIPGFERGLTGMKVGGTRRITIPPDLAYGANGRNNKVPPNATLTYEVKLLCSDR